VKTLKVGTMRFRTAKLSQLVVGDTLRNANLGSDSIQPGSLQQDAARGHSLLIQKWIAGACLSLGLVSGMLGESFSSVAVAQVNSRAVTPLGLEVAWENSVGGAALAQGTEKMSLWEIDCLSESTLGKSIVEL